MMDDKQTSFDKLRHWLKANLYIGIGKSLFLWFLAISIIPLLGVSVINYYLAYAGVKGIAEKSLPAIAKLRYEYLNNYFQQTIDFLEVETHLDKNIRFFSDLQQKASSSKLPIDQLVRSELWETYTHDFSQNLKKVMETNDLYNISFIDNTGNMIFSVKQDGDYGTNILEGPLSGTLFSAACQKILEEGGLLFSELQRYKPSGDLLCGFAGNPVRNEKGEIMGIMVVQFTTRGIDAIIQDDVGVGETGEAFLIGPDLTMRSSTRFDNESIVLTEAVKTKKSLEWQNLIRNKDDEQYIRNKELDKEEITIYANRKGEYVLGIYKNLDFLEAYGLEWALMEEIEQSEAFAYAQQLSDIAKISFIVTGILVFFIAMLVTRKFVNPIKKLSAWAKQVAHGILVNQSINAPKNEVGEMVFSFNDLVKTLQSYAYVSESAALGDYSQSVIIRSDEDVLGRSMNQMVESFKITVEQANSIAKGDYSTNVVPRSDKDTLGIALYEMTNTLRVTSKEMNEQDWMKTGIGALEGKLSGLKDLKKLTEEIITFLVEYLEGHVGLIYLVRDKKLKLVSTYAFTDPKNEYKEIEIGHGLIGQSAKEKKIILFNEPEDNIPEVNYGTGKRKPAHSIIAPFVFENNLKGTILVGSLEEISPLKQEFIRYCLDSIAIAVNTVQAHERVEKLLVRTQEQAHELQAQQEELREANEELEEQTKALKQSEENLKNQQEELRVTNEELEERTNDLELERDNIRKKNEELSKAQHEIKMKAKDLELASRYKSEFLANMSHELRTPLNSILVLSQLLSDNKKKHFDVKEIEYAKTINSSGKDLLDLINEILDLSKVESGKIDLYIEDVYFEEITTFIEKTFKPLTDSKDLDLIINVASDLPPSIRTDTQRVMQILKNLFSNAIKFTDTGSITLSISKPDKKLKFYNSKLQHGHSVAMTVSDTGIGIPKAKLKSIFEAFKQADGTTSRKYGGTGLGLTISQSFSHLINGEIHVDSLEGEGSTFTLILPETIESPQELKMESITKPDQLKKKTRKQVEKTPLKKNNYELINDDKNNLQEGHQSILIIEDDVNFCKVLYDLGHEKGFKCLIALDGETGLHYADFYQPKAIILDIGLPGIDGYEVMKRLKTNPKTRHIPIHVISASDKSLEAMKMGAIGYLTKPVSNENLEDVFKKIENIISQPIKKALVVEDDSITRKSIVNLLDEDNVSITAVESGEEALDILQKEKFECMILDLGLKNLSGYELLEKLRKDNQLIHLPIIIYTGQELTPEENEKLEKYADSIILKGAKSFERLLSEATLFLHQVQEDMPLDKQQMLKAFQVKEDILNGKKILIVDDDMRNVFALTSVLESHGVETIIGKNGKVGIEKLKENPDTHLILMDIMMPEMDGYEAMKKIRKNKDWEKLPIIALTAKAMKEDRAKCIAAGANDYLAKPVNPDKLVSLLRVWLYTK